MDFSALNEALAVKSYDRIADICDTLMLQAASEGVAYHVEWPYAVHLLGHLYINDINSARFLWKKIPTAVKESQPELSAVWKIGQKLWIKDYGSVHEAIREFNWSPQTQEIVAAFSDEQYILMCGPDATCASNSNTFTLKRMFELLLSAYSTISIQDTALFLGMNEEDATNYAVQQGWNVDPASRMLTVQKQAVATEQKLDPVNYSG